MKRFQECNRIEQIYRYRWYLLIPFKFIYHTILTNFKVYQDEIKDGKIKHTNKYSYLKGKVLWDVLIGVAQGKMKWYYTLDEVKNKIKKYEK